MTVIMVSEVATVLAAVIDANHHDWNCARKQHFEPLTFIRSNHTRVREVLWQELNKTVPPCDCYLSQVWTLFDRIKGEGAAQERYEQER